MEKVFRKEIIQTFSGGSLCFSAGTSQKSSDKIPARILIPPKSAELPGTGRFQAGLFDLDRIVFI